MSHTIEDLRALQAESLDRKLRISQTRIIEWYEKFNGQVYVAFSGGKDSTVLLHIVRQLYPDVEAVFVDTGLEYPEIKDFVKTIPNVTIIRPKMTFADVVTKYGYPVISKEVSEVISGERRGVKSLSAKMHGNKLNNDGEKSVYNCERYLFMLDAPFGISEKCCHVMKKAPSKQYDKISGKKQILGTMTDESRLRCNGWLKTGCNSFDKGREKSRPLSFWSEQDVLKYLQLTKIPYAKVYGDIVPKSEFCGQCAFDGVETDLMTTGVSRTGCMFCMFGAHLEKEPTRFQRMKETHPKQYAYCMNGGEFDEQGMWIPNKQGLGLKKVLDFINVKY